MAFEDVDGLVSPVGVAEMLGGRAGQSGIFRMRLDGIEKTPVHIFAGRGVSGIKQAAGERRVEEHRRRIVRRELIEQR